MKKTIQPPLSLTCLNYRHGGQDYLGLTVTVGFSLSLTGALLDQPEALAVATLALAPLSSQGVSLDSGLGKPRGEFLCLGDAFCPGSKPAQGVSVRLAVGNLSRAFIAMGESRDLALSISNLSHFRSLSLDWSQAAFDPQANPLGIRPGLTLGADGLPLQGPRVIELVLSSDGKANAPTSRPASPLPRPTHSRNMAAFGSFGQAWLEGSWPGFPKDFDFSFFNLAQGPQILPDGYFVGDEPVSISNMHPQRALIDSALPGKRLRLILKREQGPLSGLLEPQANLDTVWLFPNRLAGLLVWHASIATADEKCLEITEAVAALEGLSQARLTVPEILALAENGWLPLAQAGPAADLSLPSSTPHARAPEGEKPAPKRSEAPPIAPLPESQPPPLASAQSPSLTPMPSVDDIMAAARKEIEDSLPELNQALAQKGHAPLDMDSFEPYLANDKKTLQVTVDQLGKSLNMPSTDESIDNALSNMGLAKGKIDNLKNAIYLPLPDRASFPSQAEFSKAISQYAEKFSQLMGQSPGQAASMEQNLENAFKLYQGPATPELLNSLASEGKVKGLDLFGPSSQLSEKKAFIGQLALRGFEPGKAEELYETFAKVDNLQESVKDLPFATKIGQLKAIGPELDSALSLPPGAMAQLMEKEFSLTKAVAYQDPSIGEKIEALSIMYPDLKRVLNPINELRMASPQPFNSLADIAKAAGLLDQEALLAVSMIDPLNFGPAVTTDTTEPTVLPKPSAKEPARQIPHSEESLCDGQPTNPPKNLLFSSREEVIAFLSNEGNKDLAQASMAGLDLSGLNFSGLDLSGANLSGTILEKSDFKNAVLKNALFCEAVFLETTLSGSDLTNAALTSINASKTDFSQARLTGADLSNSMLEDCNFERVVADWAIFTRAKLPKNFAGAQLSRANFNKVDLNAANFEAANLSFANISNSSLKEANFTQANLTGLSLLASNLSLAKFAKAQATKASFMDGCDLSGCAFTLSDLTEATFTDSNAPSADFRGAIADRANLGQINLSGSSFVGAHMRGAILFRSDLTKADLRGADLFKACLGGANLSSANLSHSNLYAADLYRVSIDHNTSFKGSDLNSTCLVLGQTPVV
jgi:uncharacterized protein YjbI with pentapeptide repeats